MSHSSFGETTSTSVPGLIAEIESFSSLARTHGGYISTRSRPPTTAVTDTASKAQSPATRYRMRFAVQNSWLSRGPNATAAKTESSG